MSETYKLVYTDRCQADSKESAIEIFTKVLSDDLDLIKDFGVIELDE